MADTTTGHGDEIQGAASASQVEILNPDGEKELVLVVDDEAPVRNLLLTLLTRSGYRVVLASDGNDGLEVFRKISQDVDLAILDFRMPGMNGGQLFGEMRKLSPKVRAILCTGFPDEADLEDLKGQGLLELIRKPFLPAQLLEAVQSALAEE